MQDQELEQTAQEAARVLTHRAMPSGRFVSTLGQDICRAATQKVGGRPVPFQEMVVELRRLVQLLCRTLVPVSPRSAFVYSLGEELDGGMREMIAIRQERVRWLMLGGVVGSVLSLLGVLAAILLRRRNGRMHAKHPLSLT